MTAERKVNCFPTTFLAYEVIFQMFLEQPSFRAMIKNLLTLNNTSSISIRRKSKRFSWMPIYDYPALSSFDLISCFCLKCSRKYHLPFLLECNLLPTDKLIFKIEHLSKSSRFKAKHPKLKIKAKRALGTNIRSTLLEGLY